MRPLTLAPLALIILLLAACTPGQSADSPATIPVTRATTPAEPSLTPSPPPEPTAPNTPTPMPSAVQPTITPIPTIWAYTFHTLPVYGGPGPEFDEIGALEAAETVRVLSFEDGFMQVECPSALTGDCWLRFEPNDFFRYEAAAPVTLTFPDPADLDFESVVAGAISPDGRWQIGVIRSESVYLIEGVDPPYFYVAMEVSSTEDGTIWMPVAEWHGAGLGEEGPPLPFHWSEDGRYLYYTSISHPDGACSFFDNIGDYLARLDTTNGQVATLEPPYIGGILQLSPDGSMYAYTDDEKLIVRNLEAAYEETINPDDTETDSLIVEAPLEGIPPAHVREISWSADNGRILLTAVEVDQIQCTITNSFTWELDIESGTFMPVVLPTPTPIP